MCWMDYEDGMDLFQQVCKAKKLPIPEPEYRFAPPRRWRFDYAFVAFGVAVEVEGGAWTRGRHTRGKGFLNDCEKYSEAAARGWLVVRVPPGDVMNAQTFEWIERAIKTRLLPEGRRRFAQGNREP